MLAAGLDGIRRELPVPDATEENIYLIENQRQMKASVLPGSLNQALNAIEEDKVIQDALGAHTFDNFISAKRQEWEEYRLVVTDWELGKYLPNY
jgi:glutamine synthetase